jgi:hypothetical protein
MQTTHYARTQDLTVGDQIIGHIHSGREIPFSTPVTIANLTPLILINEAKEITSMTVTADHVFIRVDK